MIVTPLARITVRPAVQVPVGGPVAPPNGNPGIVPPWLQGTVVKPTVIGVGPVDPDTPTIM